MDTLTFNGLYSDTDPVSMHWLLINEATSSSLPAGASVVVYFFLNLLTWITDLLRDGTARCWRTEGAGPRALSLRTYDGHTDWINDITLLSNEATLVTAR